MRRQSRTVPAAVAVLLAIAACGSSGGSRRPPGATGPPSRVKYADCMRTNGVTNFPDPGGGGGLVVPNGINPAAPAFQTAQRACQSLMPGPGARAPATEDQEEDAARSLAVHARPRRLGFPDPVGSPPTNPAGFAMAFGRPGAYIVIPDALNPQSPAFRRAAIACRLPGTSGAPKRG